MSGFGGGGMSGDSRDYEHAEEMNAAAQAARERVERFHARVVADLRGWLAQETEGTSDDRWCAGAEQAVEYAISALMEERLRRDPADAVYETVLAAMALRARLDEEGS